jgi:hypothetical protein
MPENILKPSFHRRFSSHVDPVLRTIGLTAGAEKEIEKDANRKMSALTPKKRNLLLLLFIMVPPPL